MSSERSSCAIPMTSSWRGGGCSCKVSAALLAEMLAAEGDASRAGASGDDASMQLLADGTYLVTSVDFQNPVLDDAMLAGRIAAANAMSDLFACGVAPRSADAILGLPDSDETVAIGRLYMRGMTQACEEAGCSILGGHTIYCPTPFLGLAVHGIANPWQLKHKGDAQPGDEVFVTKPVGTGVIVAGHDRGMCTTAVFEAALGVMMTVNKCGLLLGQESAVRAMTDITGFGLLGHLCEVASQSDVLATIDIGAVPRIPGVAALVNEDVLPALARQTRTAFGYAFDRVGDVTLAEELTIAAPETNGGILFTVSGLGSSRVRQALAAQGVLATKIGDVRPRNGRGAYVLLGRGDVL